MRPIHRGRILGAGLALLLVALAAPTTAELEGPAQLDRVGELAGVRGLGELVKRALSGETPDGITVERLASGLVKIAVPLPPDSPVFREKLAKELLNCTLTVDIAVPDLVEEMVSFDVTPVGETVYHVGWVTLSTSEDDISADSSIKTRGPGEGVDVSDTVLYTASAINLLWIETTGFAEGIHAIDAKVKGAKPAKLKGHFCVGCV